jgi:PAS domain S-box-containing protein
MPQSAIATGTVDYILPVAEIPDVILRYDRTEPRIAVPTDGQDVPQNEQALLQKVFAQLRARTDRDFSRYKRSTVLRRVAKRMQLNYLEDLPNYLDRLRERPEEVRALADDLLITVTHFFRDPEVFEKLEKTVLPRIFERKGPKQSIRAWSVGCATGEEAYSLAMLLAEHAVRHETPPQIQVFASDLHARSLEKAREGFYPGDIATDVGTERLRRFFVEENGGYRVQKELREMVVFAPHNILADPPFSRIDLISCRNLLIYLERDVQRDVIELFHYALNPDGALILGTAESVDATDLFRVEDKRLCFYHKRNVPAREPRLPVFPLIRTNLPGEIPNPTANGGPIGYGKFHQQMLEEYAPPSILVSPDNQLAHLSENAGRYLMHPGGEPTASVLKLVRQELRIELQVSLQTAREHKKALDSKPIPVQFNGHARPVVLHLRPALEPERDGFVLVIFVEREPSHEGEAPAAEDSTSTSDTEHTRDLERELRVVRQRLQAIIEEHETSQEEMKASSEEMQSTNEELRSTMEELETSKEELQSINEELQTVNQQNRHKVEELGQLSSDLQNLLSATDIATLFLDRDLRILRFTPKLGELFNVRFTDRGRPISDLTDRLGYSGLRQDAEAVLSRLAPIERELQDDAGRWYLVRVLPYRSTEERIEGIVVTFVDIDTRKKAEERLRANEERLRRMVNVDVVGVLVFSESGALIDSNDAFLKMTGYTREQINSGKLTWREMTPPEYMSISEQQWQNLAATGRIGPYEKEYIRSDGSRASMMFVGAGLGNGTLVEYAIDVSDRKRAEVEAREASAYAENVIRTLHEPLLVLTPDLRVTSANPAFYRFFKVQTAETLGRQIYDLGNGQWNIPMLRRLLEETLPQNGEIEEFEVDHTFDNIGRRVMLLNARKVDHRGLILLGLRDITERKRLEENLADRVRKSTQALDSTQAELRELSGRLMATQEEERRRIARELHDDFAQRTAVMDLALERLVSHLPSPQGVEALAELREQLAQLSADLRQVSHRLHPSSIADLGLPAALNQLVQEFNDTGGEAHFLRSSRTPHLTVDQATVLYRIAQEALRNAMKHAPGSLVRIALAMADQHVRLYVEDTGPGFNLDEVRDGRGLGLVSMQERARLLGGNLEVWSKAGVGTRISVRLKTIRG